MNKENKEEAMQAARREYYRIYRERNRERIQQNAKNFWERKALEFRMLEQGLEQG